MPHCSIHIPIPVTKSITPQTSRKSPKHFSSKPIAQYLAEARLVDEYDVAFSETASSDLKREHAAQIRRSISCGKVQQKVFYHIFI